MGKHGVLRVAIAQFAPKLGAAERNMLRIIEGIRKAAATNARLVVFPELFLTGYSCRDYFLNLAVPKNSKIIDKIVAEASDQGVAVAFGAPLHDGDLDLLYNALVIIVDEKIYTYYKVQLANFGPFEEKIQFASGEALATENLPMIDGIKVGPLICYDIFFPELAKNYALRGAKLLLHIAASPYFSKKYFEIVGQARAIECTTPYIFCNYVGVERGLVFWGGSRVILPSGHVIAKAKEYCEDFVVADIDIKMIKAARMFRPTLRDEKPSARSRI